jgi:hypothetical protein
MQIGNVIPVLSEFGEQAVSEGGRAGELAGPGIRVDSGLRS